MRIYSLFIALFMLLSGVLYAQTSGTITGTVKDDKTGEPLIGATVVLEGTNLGAATNTEGRYTINNIPTKTYKVKASFVGFITETKFNVVVRSAGNIELNFELEENVSENELPRCKQTGYQSSRICEDLCNSLYSFSTPCSRTYFDITFSSACLPTVLT
jgi:hypothetical protein